MSGNKEKPKKQVRNKGRDVFVDYYKTNREYSKENEARYEEERRRAEASGKRRGWSYTEKLYLGVIIVGLILIAVKYFIL